MILIYINDFYVVKLMCLYPDMFFFRYFCIPELYKINKYRNEKISNIRSRNRWYDNGK